METGRFFARMLLMIMVVIATGLPASGQQGTQDGEWRYYGGDIGGTKYSPLCTAPGSLDTHLCYAAWRSSYSSRASIGV